MEAQPERSFIRYSVVPGRGKFHVVNQFGGYVTGFPTRQEANEAVSEYTARG